jgi:DNA-3-methyladenine glycosylase I
MERCAWSEKDDLYRKYHDEEWGKPVYDDAVLFEFLVLETFQAGLSWHTILKRRETFRSAFDAFDVHKIAKYTDEKESQLLQDEGIIRNKLKVKATTLNALAFLEVQKEFGTFSNYLWQFTNGKSIFNKPKTLKDVPATSDLSDKLSKDLKKRGFKFVGSTVVYAFMQAVGLVNDHVSTCHLYTK